MHIAVDATVFAHCLLFCSLHSAHAPEDSLWKSGVEILKTRDKNLTAMRFHRTEMFNKRRRTLQSTEQMHFNASAPPTKRK